MTATDRPTVQDLPVRPEPPGGGRRGWWVVAALIGVVAVVAALLLWLPGDDGGEQATSTTDAPSTAPPTTAPPTTATTPPAGTDTTALWPFPGATTSYSDPVDAARVFATEFLRFEDPVVAGFQQGDTRSGEVPIRPSDRGPVTTILVRQLSSSEDWSVLGAVTANIDVTSPGVGEEISSPVAVSGRALAFEGNVQVEVREDGELGALGAGFVTGGGDEMRAFTGSIAFDTPGSPYGALVFFTTSMEDGQVWEATAFRVALSSSDVDAAGCAGYAPQRPQPGAGEMEVKAYFTCDTGDGEPAPSPVYRIVPRSPGVLEASLEALLAGPSAADRDGSLSSWFSAETAGMLRSVTITDGHAVVDFGDLAALIPNASTSAGSALLLSELDATVFQFPSVASVEYRMEGSCEAFNEWLQYGGCDRRTRPASQD